MCCFVYELWLLFVFSLLLLSLFPLQSKNSMDLKEIMVVSGRPGLFKYLADGRNGIIVESLTDKTRTFIPATARVSALSDIAIFTDTGEISLREVLKKIREKENGQPSLNPKSDDKEIREYFESVVPDYNKERVYLSDMKKVFVWYNILQQQNLLEILDAEEKKEDKVKDEKSPVSSRLSNKPHVEKPVKENTREVKTVKPTHAGLKAGSSSRKSSD